MSDQLRQALINLLDAADSFLANSPEDMPDRHPFNQYTSAGNCRELTKVYREARTVLKKFKVV